MNTLPPLARVPLLVLGLASLVTGVLAGLARVGACGQVGPEQATMLLGRACKEAIVSESRWP